ncbi:hypothetical protein SDC9_184188 [bioreactor metagenome]|uniref:Uncharacterized protein n=1 Tax=bioreactor metagenome TaxID=1076179 RepID=A0A645HCC1_9ZZZZ
MDEHGAEAIIQSPGLLGGRGEPEVQNSFPKTRANLRHSRRNRLENRNLGTRYFADHVQSINVFVRFIRGETITAEDAFGTKVCFRARKTNDEICGVEVLAIRWLIQDVCEGSCGIANVG